MAGSDIIKVWTSLISPRTMRSAAALPMTLSATEAPFKKPFFSLRRNKSGLTPRSCDVKTSPSETTAMVLAEDSNIDFAFSNDILKSHAETADIAEIFPLFSLFLRAKLFNVFHKQISAEPLYEHSRDAETEIVESCHE